MNSKEWNWPIYVIFIDYVKAFDSVDRQTLWRLIRHYGVPEKLTIIKNAYKGLMCRIVHGRKLADAFQVKAGVRQGCLLSLFLFRLTIDWIMKTSTTNQQNGIQWTLCTHLDDLDLPDDLALLSHTQTQMHDETSTVTAMS